MSISSADKSSGNAAADIADDEITISSIEYYKSDAVKHFIYIIISVLSIGVVPLVSLFFPSIRVILSHTFTVPEHAEVALVSIKKNQNSSNPAVATVHVVDVYHTTNVNEIIVAIEVQGSRFCASSIDRYRLNKVPLVPKNYIRFILRNATSNSNSSIRVSDQSSTTINLLQDERKLLHAQFGDNKMLIPETSFLEILAINALSPFFLFQYFAVVLWFIEDYILYSILILLITFATIYLNTTEMTFNLKRLRELAKTDGTVQFIDDVDSKNKSIYTSSDTALVPGDKFYISENMSLPCDAILLTGRVIVDESMLTGESVPVTKTPIDISIFPDDVSKTTYDIMKDCSGVGNDAFDKNNEVINRYTSHLLFSGTRVTACHGDECIAITYRTGFRSAKGQLISTLIDPKKGYLTFFSDALWLILLMVIFTTCLYSYYGVQLKDMGASTPEVIFRYFDAITLAVPPALTACLSIATAMCIARLKVKNIYISDTTRVNWAGGVNAASFDKTGTLTEDAFKYQGVSVYNSSSRDSASSNSVAFTDYGSDEVDKLPLVCVELMASCHNLSLLSGVQLCGDPLEMELFKVSRWSLFNAVDTGKSNVKPPQSDSNSGTSISAYKVMRHFEFSPERSRAATILRRTATPSSYVYLVKGSPETVIGLCDSRTTDADAIAMKLKLLARKGYRLLAMAYKEFSDDDDSLLTYSQDDFEGSKSLTFLGIVYLSSALKHDTISTITALNSASMHINMITGDHIQTAISIAMECGILSYTAGSSNVLYMIAERDDAEGVCIIDYYMDEVVADIELEDLMNLVAASSLVESHVRKSLLMNLPRPRHGSQLYIGNIQLATTGKALAYIRKNYPKSTVNSLLRYTSVFARTKPTDKKLVVEEMMQISLKDYRLKQLLEQYSKMNALLSTSSANASHHTGTKASDHINSMTKSSDGSMDDDGSSDESGKFNVLFCGDGANDMAALRAATIGVSLCDAETSVAAPVTSKLQTPGAVIHLLLEGRCSLITAYVLVMFNIMYGVIQLMMCCLLYNYGLAAGTYMYLTQDLFFTLVLGIAIVYTDASLELNKQLPPGRFFNRFMMAKLLLQLACFIFFQVISLEMLKGHSWYTMYTTDDPLSSTYSYEATTVDTVALAQLMIASIVSTIGQPFRQEWYKNWYHVSALVLQFVWILYQLFGGNNYFSVSILEIKPLPTSFACILLVLILINALTSFVLNYFVNWLKLSSTVSLDRDMYAAHESYITLVAGMSTSSSSAGDGRSSDDNGDDRQRLL